MRVQQENFNDWTVWKNKQVRDAKAESKEATEERSQQALHEFQIELTSTALSVGLSVSLRRESIFFLYWQGDSPFSSLLMKEKPRKTSNYYS